MNTIHKIIILLIILQSISSYSFCEKWNEQSIILHRDSFGIPQEEKELSNQELIDHLHNNDAWTIFAIHLRILTESDDSRKELFDTLVQFALEDLKNSESSRDYDSKISYVLEVFTILKGEMAIRDEAVSSVFKIMDQVSDSNLKHKFHRTLSKLGGERAIRELKRTVLNMPPNGAGGAQTARVNDTWRFLYSCGPEMASILFEDIDKIENSLMLNRVYYAIGMSGNEEYVPILLDKATQAKENEDENAYSTLLKATYVQAKNYTQETQDLIIEALLSEVDSDSTQIKFRVLEGLEKIGTRQHISILENIAINDSHTGKDFPNANEGDLTPRTIYPIREEAVKAIIEIEARLEKEKTSK